MPMDKPKIWRDLLKVERPKFDFLLFFIMIFRNFSGCLISAAIVLHFLYNYFFSVNFPYQDDFLLIQFIEVVSSTKLSVNELVTELFRTFNDHKAVIPRLFSLVD